MCVWMSVYVYEEKVLKLNPLLSGEQELPIY